MPEPPLTLERFREQPAHLILVISSRRDPHDYDAYVRHWGRLFELLRSMRTSDLKIDLHDRDPWATMGADTGAHDIQLWRVGGSYRLQIRMPKKLEKAAPNWRLICRGSSTVPASSHRLLSRDLQTALSHTRPHPDERRVKVV